MRRSQKNWSYGSIATIDAGAFVISWRCSKTRGLRIRPLTVLSVRYSRRCIATDPPERLTTTHRLESEWFVISSRSRWVQNSYLSIASSECPTTRCSSRTYMETWMLLRRAVRADELTNLRYLIIGGDIAPNLVTIQLRDGEFVLRHEEFYGAKVSEDFRSRLRDGRQYQRDDEHGKRPVTKNIDMDAETFLSLGKDETKALLEPLSSFDFLRKRQSEFVETELLPLLRSFRSNQESRSFVMLGNDDFVELEPLLLMQETSGRFTYIHNRVVPLGSSQVLGYSCVLSKPFRYRHWERTEEEFAARSGQADSGSRHLETNTLDSHAALRDQPGHARSRP